MVPAGDRDEGSAAAEEGAAGISQEAGNLREKKKRKPRKCKIPNLQLARGLDGGWE